MVRSSVLFSIFLAGCGTGPGADGPGDTDTAAVDTDTTGIKPPDEPPPYLHADDVGSIVLVKTTSGITGTVNTSLYGTFADSLSGLPAAALCVAGELCLSGPLPPEDNFVDVLGFSFPAAGAEWTWVGDQITVGSMDAPFLTDPAMGNAYYYDVEPPIEEKDPWLVEVGGEWGDWSGDIANYVRMDVLAPELESGISFGQGGIIAFAWEPKEAESDVVLRIAGDDFDRVWNLADDGNFELSLNSVSLDPLGEYKVTLSRWTTTLAEVNDGNQLEVITVDTSQWTALECADWPNLIIEANDATFYPPIDPAWVSFQISGIIAGDHMFDAFYDYDADGDLDGITSQVIFGIYAGDPLYGLVEEYLCTVVFDASDALAVDPATFNPIIQKADGTDYALYNGFIFDLHDGFTDCGPLDLGTFGTTDIRTYLAREDLFQWGFAVGEKSPAITTQLKAAFGVPGWQDYAGTTSSGWMTPNGATLYEGSYAYGLELGDCPDVAMPEQRIPTVTSSSFETAWWNSFYFTVFTITP